MLYRLLRYGGSGDGIDTLGEAVPLSDHRINHELKYGIVSPDPAHSSYPSVLKVGEYTIGVRDDDMMFKVLAEEEPETKENES